MAAGRRRAAAALVVALTVALWGTSLAGCSAPAEPPAPEPATKPEPVVEAKPPTSPPSQTSGSAGGGLTGGTLGGLGGLIGKPGAAGALAACAGAGMAAFPWPDPPQPSVSALIPRYLLFGTDTAPTRSLAAVAARLDAAIAQAGYLQPRTLRAGCNGFAVVLDLEAIRADGTREAGVAGFTPPGEHDAFSLSDYVRGLFHAPPGQYRQIVFVVSDQRMARAQPAPTEGQLRAIARDGRSSLPPAFERVPFTPAHEVLALIYEFEKGPRDGDMRIVPPEGRLRATVHLKQARLY